MWSEQIVRSGARTYPDKVAVRDDHREVTFAELDRRTAALAGALRTIGVEGGSRIAVSSANRVEIVETYLALARLGACFVPLRPAMVPAEAQRIAASAGVKMILGESAALKRLGASDAGLPAFAIDGEWYEEAAQGPPCDLREVAMTELAAVFHTSATTGTPKLVGLDHRHMTAAGLALLAVTPVPADSVVLACNPLYHASMFVLLTFMSQGATVRLRRSFTPQGCLATIEREQATHLWLVPETLRFLLRARALATTDISSVREVIYAASPMPPALLREAHQRLGCRFRQIYGMTEALLITCLRPEQHDFSGPELAGGTLSVGRPVPDLSVEVRDERGRALPQGAIGEVCVRGDAVIGDYLGAAQATEDVFAGRWLRTGDRGRFDREGFLHLEGRVKDLIIRGGQKVVPLEVERVLEQHPEVAEAAVVGQPDGDWGQTPVAFIVPRGQGRLAQDDVMRFCVDRLDDYKRPSSVHVVSALPRSVTGKLLRRQLRTSAAVPTPWSTTVTSS